MTSIEFRQPETFAKLIILNFSQKSEESYSLFDKDFSLSLRSKSKWRIVQSKILQSFQPENNTTTVGCVFDPPSKTQNDNPCKVGILAHHNDHPSLRALQRKAWQSPKRFRHSNLNKTVSIASRRLPQFTTQQRNDEYWIQAAWTKHQSLRSLAKQGCSNLLTMKSRLCL